MKILITGGKGFIARNLFEQLNTQYRILSCSREELDLLDYKKVFDFIKNNRFDVIIHTATYDAAPKDSPKDPTKVLEYNLKMFFNLLRCKDYFGKMLYFGSGAEFDRQNWIPKMKEDYFDQHIPQDQYGFSKYIMTKYAELSNNVYNLRLFAVFGKYEDWRYRFISNVCCKAVLDLPLVINQNNTFDFLYIDDLVRIVKWFIENQPKRKVYNVCTGKSFDFKTIAEKILKISNKKLEIIIKDKTPGIEYSGDNSLLLEELGGFDFTPLDEALKTLYNWYEKNKHIIQKDKFHY
jgi:GDP-L-fucose synthase